MALTKSWQTATANTSDRRLDLIRLEATGRIGVGEPLRATCGIGGGERATAGGVGAPDALGPSPPAPRLP